MTVGMASARCLGLDSRVGPNAYHIFHACCVVCHITNLATLAAGSLLCNPCVQCKQQHNTDKVECTIHGRLQLLQACPTRGGRDEWLEPRLAVDKGSRKTLSPSCRFNALLCFFGNLISLKHSYRVNDLLRLPLFPSTYSVSDGSCYYRAYHHVITVALR